MKVLIIIGFLVATVSATIFGDNAVEFQDFKLMHGKTYKNRAEEIIRFTIFKDNLRIIEAHNALYEQGLVSYKQGVTRFADMTQDEFSAWLTFNASKEPQINCTKHINTGLAIVDSLDWRTRGRVTGIKDQGSCGACWAFSITGSTEGAYALKSGKLVSLSEQQLIDCSTDINNGCSGGHLHESFSYVEQHGLESEKSYSYRDVDGSCKYNVSDVVTKVSDYKCMDFKDEDAILDAIANIGPVSVGMDATFLSLYHGGIYIDSKCSPVYLNHALLIVGYGSENGTPFWIVKNSWGTSWGEQGYLRVRRGTDECGIAEDTVYPIIN